jgi:hypothetical protein
MRPLFVKLNAEDAKKNSHPEKNTRGGGEEGRRGGGGGEEGRRGGGGEEGRRGGGEGLIVKSDVYTSSWGLKALVPTGAYAKALGEGVPP